MKYCREGTFFDFQQNRCLECSDKCVACYGNKDSCTICPDGQHEDYGVCRNTCIHGYKRNGTSGLRLTPDPIPFYVSPSRGLVEMFVDGKWVSVCSTNWDVQSAAVACHELGYGDPINIFRSEKNTWRDKVEIKPKLGCNGTERKLSQCRRGKYCMLHIIHLGGVSESK